jgi:hypothetical protein
VGSFSFASSIYFFPLDSFSEKWFKQPLESKQQIVSSHPI